MVPGVISILLRSRANDKQKVHYYINYILLVPHFTHLYSKSNVRRSVTRLTNAIPTLLKRKFSSNFSVKLRKKERRTNN